MGANDEQLTFFPPEDVRSGFTDSPFSLLEDLDRLLFSFSADSGESLDGLTLLLFLEESARGGEADHHLAFCRFPPCVRQLTGSVFVLSPFGVLAHLVVVEEIVLAGEGDTAALAAVTSTSCSKQTSATDSLPLLPILLFLLLFGSA